MQREFLQEKSLNRNQDNAEKSLNVDLSAKSRLIPFSTTQGMLGLYDLYVEERNACENYRMIFTVSPVCSNVLYNAVTEPVFKEGSDLTCSLVQTPIDNGNTKYFEYGPVNVSGKSESLKIDQIFAVRDTELSHEKIGNFKYHCGYDIFNNHLLRTDDFNHVKLANDSTNKETFNTIFDFAIDYSGNPVERIVDEEDGAMETTGNTANEVLEKHRQKVRMYQVDNIKTFNAAFYDGLREVDGWYGFYNSGYINIPNATVAPNIGNGQTEDISVNRILNNETPCSFIDLYPDRTLFSFIPKVNRFRKRIERNWDCTIVYPYKSDYDMFNRVMLNFSGTSDEWSDFKNENESCVPNAVRILKARVTYNNVGDEVIEMTSLLRHTLEPGDEIRLFYTTSDYISGDYREIKRFSVPVRVINVGDTEGNNRDRCFFIKFSDIATFCEIDEESKEICEMVSDTGVTGDKISFFYRKVEDGYDDNYYFRKFKQLKIYEYYPWNEEVEQDKLVVLKKEPLDVNENSPLYIKVGDEYFKRNDRPLTYTQNKIAFAENIYGDRVAQVIFNDDICITGLKDNIGRPLSTVYFTAIKTNRGYKTWYEEGDTKDEKVEYSHCFGDLTSGLDLPEYTEIKEDAERKDAVDYNVRRIYSVFSGDCTDTAYVRGLEIILSGAPGGHGKDGTPLPLESGITADFNEFYGDIVEFNRASFKETTIDKVYFRFNTAQRECLKNDKYFDIHYDYLYGDIYDVDTGDTEAIESNSGFSVSSYTLNQVQNDDNEEFPFPGNIAPEGYFYSPFYEVTLKELDDELQFVTTRRINFVPDNGETSAYTSSVTFYDPDMGSSKDKNVCVINIVSPTGYDFITGRPFSIYDIDKNFTYRGYLSNVTASSGGGYLLEIITEAEIDSGGLRGEKSDLAGKSQYIIAMLDDNAPTYAEYVPASGKLVWRSPKKMSDLSSDSPLYNMPFTNGRHYIHRNLNVYVRRQDPHGEFNLFRPSRQNPLRRFQLEGDARLDFGLIKYIIDSLVDAC